MGTEALDRRKWRMHVCIWHSWSAELLQTSLRSSVASWCSSASQHVRT